MDIGIEGLIDSAEVGRGGFGVVYRAVQPRFSRAVAVKVLSFSHTDGAALQRFEREISAMGKLSGHPNVVTVYEAGVTASGAPYIVMEFLQRGSLAHAISGAPMEWGRAVTYTARIAGALQAAHDLGILHRDVKPENVMLSDFGEPKLSDFGLAHLAGGLVTQSGLLTATIQHSAPEVFSGAAPSRASDIYSLGSTLFSLLAGRPAFDRPGEDLSMWQYIARIADEPVPDLRPTGVPPAVCSVVEAAMAKRPEDRPQSAADVARALQGAQAAAGMPPTDVAFVPGQGVAPTVNLPHAGEGDSGQTQALAPKRRRRLLLAGIVAGLAIAAVAGVLIAVALVGNRSTPVSSPPTASTAASTTSSSGSISSSRSSSAPTLNADTIRGALLSPQDLPGSTRDASTDNVPSMGHVYCGITPPTNAPIYEAKVSLSSRSTVANDVALFRPGAAETFMHDVGTAAGQCPNLVGSQVQLPPGLAADQALRLQFKVPGQDQWDIIYLRKGDLVSYVAQQNSTFGDTAFGYDQGVTEQAALASLNRISNPTSTPRPTAS